MINLIDVGATGGLEPPWRDRPDMLGTVLSFEPNEPSAVTAKAIRYNKALWNFDGEAQFTIYGQGGVGSSLLKQNIDWVREHYDQIRNQGDLRLNETWFDRAVPTGKFRCQIGRLDNILSELRSDNIGKMRFHFLKSDTQSGEWFVLEGARQYLAEECLGLELECFRYPLYQGIVLENDVIAFLAEIGFDVFGWTGYKNSFFSQADYLFLRRNPRTEEDRAIIESIKKLYGTSGPSSLIKKERLFSRAKRKVAALKKSLSAGN